MKTSIIKTTVLLVILTLGWGWSFGQDDKGGLTTEPVAGPWFIARVYFSVPDNTPAGTVVTINATWFAHNPNVLSSPDKKQEVTVIDGKKDYRVDFYWVTDAQPYEIHLCAGMKYQNMIVLKYASCQHIFTGNNPDDVFLSGWNNNGCAGTTGPGGGGTE
jgi:hypothetical protein